MSSAILNASPSDVPRSTKLSSRSFGIVISVSTVSRSARMPCSACAAPLPFEREGLGHDSDGERAQLRGQRRDDRRRAGAGAAAHAGGDEDHVGAVKRLEDAIGVFKRRLLADLGIRAGAEAFRELAADLQLGRGQRCAHRQNVGVRDHELDALDACLNHSVDGVPTTPAHPDDFDPGRKLVIFHHDRQVARAGLLVKCDHLPSPGRLLLFVVNSMVK
jgi:hypothetical protein